MAPKQHQNTNMVVKWISLVALSIFLLLMLMPFVMVTINSLKTEAEFGQYGPLSLPHGLNLTSLKDFWTRVNFSQPLKNSTIISVSVAILALVFSLLNAFALGLQDQRKNMATGVLPNGQLPTSRSTSLSSLLFCQVPSHLRYRSGCYFGLYGDSRRLWYLPVVVGA
jgi:ABC-type Fe3+ transport system permease subunit